LFESTLRFHERFRYDIALFSPDSVFIVRPAPFSIRRLSRRWAWARSRASVRLHLPGGLEESLEQRPPQHQRGGHRPGAGRARHARLCRVARVAAATGRGDLRCGVASRVRPGRRNVPDRKTVVTEINDRSVAVVGLVEIGPSFGIDGTVLTSVDNWLRLFPDRSRNQIQLGLVTLAQAQDPSAVRDRLRSYFRPTCS